MQARTLTIPDTSLIWISRTKKGQDCSRERGNSGSGDYGSAEWFSKGKKCPLWPSIEITHTRAELSKRDNYSAKPAFELRHQPWNEIVWNKHRGSTQPLEVFLDNINQHWIPWDRLGRALMDLCFSGFIKADRTTLSSKRGPQKQVLMDNNYSTEMSS